MDFINSTELAKAEYVSEAKPVRPAEQTRQWLSSELEEWCGEYRAKFREEHGPQDDYGTYDLIELGEAIAAAADGVRKALEVVNGKFGPKVNLMDLTDYFADCAIGCGDHFHPGKLVENEAARVVYAAAKLQAWRLA